MAFAYDKIARERDFLIRYIAADLESTFLADSLSAIRSLIADSAARFQEHHDQDDEFLEIIASEERELTDAFLGCAFVVCQSYITAVACKVVTAANRFLIDGATDKDKVKRLGVRQSTLTGATVIEEIDAAANYFKHHEEWDTEERLPEVKGPDSNGGDGATRVWVWLNTIKDREGKDVVTNGGQIKSHPGKRTREIVSKMQLVPYDSQNILRIAEYLQVADNDCAGLPSLASRIKEWHRNLVEIVRKAEFRAKSEN